MIFCALTNTLTNAKLIKTVSSCVGLFCKRDLTIWGGAAGSPLHPTKQGAGVAQKSTYVCGALLREYRALLRECRAVLREYRALLRECRALLRIYDAVSRACRAI